MMITSQLSYSHLPDIVNECERQVLIATRNDSMKITCKEIAHSLRLVADQMDRKYCQVSFSFYFITLNNIFFCLGY